MARDVEYLSNPDPARPTSRYNHIRLYVDHNKNMVQETLDFSTITFPPQPGDITRKVRSGEDHRPDLVSKDRYGRLDLFWVVARANGWSEPFAQCIAGVTIRLPDPEYVNTILAQR